MVVLSKAAESLPEGFGFVLLTGVGNVFVQMWMAINVGRARKQYEVKVCNSLTSLSVNLLCNANNS